ncbi:MAG TPA: acetate uptake transporter, partial [Streptosporangiaceae bacterium]|nr:acetate uptake transporter [Streptosporangiaceae bacterium]
MTSAAHYVEPAADGPARIAAPATAAPVTATGVAWGNSAPLALAAFAVTTFMLSMVNASIVPKAVTPFVFGVALMFGGLTQLIAGVIQLRTGNTFAGVLFSGFGAFWLSLWAIAEFFLKGVPPVQAGHGLGLFLYAFGIFAAIMLVASLRTSVAVVTAL